MNEKTCTTADENGHVTQDQNEAVQPTETEISDKDLRYGWFSLKPTWMQALNAATIYAIWLSCVNVFQSGTTNGLAGAIQFLH